MTTPAPQPSSPFGQWIGGQVSTHAHCLLQGNPGPMTLDGTNTWVVMAPGSSSARIARSSASLTPTEIRISPSGS